MKYQMWKEIGRSGRSKNTIIMKLKEFAVKAVTSPSFVTGGPGQNDMSVVKMENSRSEPQSRYEVMKYVGITFHRKQPFEDSGWE